MDILKIGENISKAVDKLLVIGSSAWERHDLRAEKKTEHRRQLEMIAVREKKLQNQRRSEREVLELQARLTKQKFQLEDLLRENQHNRDIEKANQEFELWKSRIEFQIEIVQRFLEFISHIQTEHAFKVINAIAELEDRYKNTFTELLQETELIWKKVDAYQKEILPFRDTAPEYYQIRLKSIERLSIQNDRLIKIVIDRLENYLPYLEKHLLESTRFDPIQLVSQITQGRANPKEVAAYLEAKEIDWDIARQEQQELLQPPRDAE